MARSFAGGSDTIKYPAGFGAVAGCHAFWIKTTQTATNACPWSHWDSANSKNGIGFILNNTANKILAHCKYNNSGSAFAISSTTNINDGNWHHVAVNWQTGAGQPNYVFVDGNQEGSANTAVGWTYNTTSSNPSFGVSNDTFWLPFVGEIAEAAVWDTALSANEIAALAKGYTPKHIAPTHLQFYTPFVRGAQNLNGTSYTTISGTTVSNHPRMIG